tara:strand:- start:533 stop:1843 length:1311 start_codon:yes stop_codon:yes gene_type:complete
MQYAGNSLEHQWMPFTNNRDFKADPRLVVRGEGCYLWSHDDKKILDGSSGLFCVAAGHGRKEIADAVHEQLMTLDYSAPFNLGHPAAFEVARRVAQLTPEGLDHVFFANSGSEAVDSAMKIALAYHYAKGQGQRQRFVSRERAYHGVNFGGVALSGLIKNREAFGVGMPAVAHMRHTWLEENRFTRGQPDDGAELADDLARIAANFGPGTIAACFVEPVAGSTGFLIPPKGYLERLREICDEHGILLVFDEVICGFGRTGEAFASQSFDVMPDMMTMAKALTNGCQPMGAVVVNDEIYDTVTGSAPDGAIELFHGYTYSGHPAACAASLATLDIYERENLFAKGAELSPYFLDSVFALSDLPVITDIRGYGLMAAIDVAPEGGPGARGYELQKRLYKAGMHIKFTGDAGLLAPPLVSEKEHIDEMCAIFRDVLSSY